MQALRDVPKVAAQFPGCTRRSGEPHQATAHDLARVGTSSCRATAATSPDAMLPSRSPVDGGRLPWRSQWGSWSPSRGTTGPNRGRTGFDRIAEKFLSFRSGGAHGPRPLDLRLLPLRPFSSRLLGPWLLPQASPSAHLTNFLRFLTALSGCARVAVFTKNSNSSCSPKCLARDSSPCAGVDVIGCEIYFRCGYTNSGAIG